MISKNNITGFVLAGGKSSRMGKDKGLLKLHEKAMTEIIMEQLQPCVKEMMIVSNNDEYKLFGLPVIHDLIEGIGPAGGIFTGLNHSKTELNFFISCDMPFVNCDVIENIIQQSFDAEITVPVMNQHIEPLCGVYSKSCLWEWELLINNGIIKLQDLIQHFRNKIVDMTELGGLQNPFLNINTEEQYNDALNMTTTWK